MYMTMNEISLQFFGFKVSSFSISFRKFSSITNLNVASPSFSQFSPSRTPNRQGLFHTALCLLTTPVFSIPLSLHYIQGRFLQIYFQEHQFLSSLMYNLLFSLYIMFINFNDSILFLSSPFALFQILLVLCFVIFFILLLSLFEHMKHTYVVFSM